MSNAEKLAEIIKYSAHSFRAIREQTSLKLNDAQFSALIREYPELFASVRFAKKNDQGDRIMPGRPGVKMVGR